MMISGQASMVVLIKVILVLMGWHCPSDIASASLCRLLIPALTSLLATRSVLVYASLAFLQA